MAVQDPKADLLKWANSQLHLAAATKAVLKELASFADADGCAWAKVETLAYGTNIKERQVQRHLETLREAGLIRLSGRQHRLKKSTRSVPLYQLAPELFEALEGAVGAPPMGGVDDTHTGVSMGGVDDTHAGEYGCHGRQPMGGVDDTPHRRSTGDQSGAEAPSPGAREASPLAQRSDFDRLVEAVPQRVLKFADLEAAWCAFEGLAEQGVEVARLADCARRMAADPEFVSRKHPPPLQDWLGKGQWRGWWVEAGAVTPPAADLAEVSDVPPELRAAVLAVTDPAFVGAYLLPCRYLDGPPPRLVARTSIAVQRLDRVSAVLREFGVSVVVGEKA